MKSFTLSLKILSFLLFLSLSGCAALKTKPKAPVLWPTQNIALEKLSHWTIAGKMSVKNNETGGNGNFTWELKLKDDIIVYI